MPNDQFTKIPRAVVHPYVKNKPPLHGEMNYAKQTGISIPDGVVYQFMETCLLNADIDPYVIGFEAYEHIVSDDCITCPRLKEADSTVWLSEHKDCDSFGKCPFQTYSPKVRESVAVFIDTSDKQPQEAQD